MFAALALIASIASAADQLVIPPTRMACGSNYTTHTLTLARVAALAGEVEVAHASIDDPSARAPGEYNFRTAIAAAVTINAMRLACTYAIDQGRVTHTLEYRFAALAWPLAAGDTAILRINVAGQVAQGDRSVAINGVEAFVPSPSNLHTAANVAKP